MYVSDKKCDGIVHCIEGKDETYETCKDIFPEEATINCNERPSWYDIRDMAIPCNDIPECVDEKDGNCDENKGMLFGVAFGLLVLTNVIYHYLKWYRLEWRNQTILNGSISDNLANVKYSKLIGDDLANLKVFY